MNRLDQKSSHSNDRVCENNWVGVLTERVEAFKTFLGMNGW